MVEGHDQAYERALPRPARAHESRRGSCRSVERDIPQDLHPRLVLERYVLEGHVPFDRLQRYPLGPVLIFLELRHDLADPVKAGERLADLGADVGDLYQRRHHEAHEDHVEDQVTQRHGAVQDRLTTHEHDQDAHEAHDHRRHGADGRGARDGRGHVAEQPESSVGEHALFPALRDVGLQHADAPEAFAQPARHLGVDLAALAEDGPQLPERERHGSAEGHE